MSIFKCPECGNKTFIANANAEVIIDDKLEIINTLFFTLDTNSNILCEHCHYFGKIEEFKEKEDDNDKMS